MHDLAWLEENFPAAYKAMPECYRADSCLTFYLDVNGNLCAAPKPGQAAALGNMFGGANTEWVFVHFGALSGAGILAPKWVEADSNWREEDEGPDSEEM